MKIKSRVLNKEELKALKNELEEQLGRKIKLYRQGGCYIAQAYSVPTNPRTKLQRKNRTLLAKASKAASALTLKEKEPYRKRASKKKGWSWLNVFVVEYLQKASRGA